MTSALPERSDAANADTVASVRQTVGVCVLSPDGKAAPRGRRKKLVEFCGGWTIANIGFLSYSGF